MNIYQILHIRLDRDVVINLWSLDAVTQKGKLSFNEDFLCSRKIFIVIENSPVKLRLIIPVNHNICCQLRNLVIVRVCRKHLEGCRTVDVIPDFKIRISANGQCLYPGIVNRVLLAVHIGFNRIHLQHPSSVNQRDFARSLEVKVIHSLVQNNVIHDILASIYRIG